MKRWILAAALAVGLAAGATPAVAAPPTPADGLTLTWTCPNFSDPVVGVVTGKFKTITLPDGSQINTSPNLKITLTANGKTVSYVITGVTFVEYPNASHDTINVTATGWNLITVPEANGHPAGLFLTTGNYSWTLNPDGTENTFFSGNGRVVDVCQVLAP